MEHVNRSLSGKLREFSKECMRVLKVTKKPNMTEFKQIVIITGIGMLIIGFIGFVIAMARQLLFP